MRIICGYAGDGLRPETRDVLEAVGAELLDFTGDDFAYWNAIMKRWDGKQALIVVEQDIGVTSEIILSFRECSEPWCSYWYRGPAYCICPGSYGSIEDATVLDIVQLKFSLGCTKFSAEIQNAVSLAGPERHWGCLDIPIATELITAGYMPHVHGEVEHFHKYVNPFADALCEERFTVSYPQREVNDG